MIGGEDRPWTDNPDHARRITIHLQVTAKKQRAKPVYLGDKGKQHEPQGHVSKPVYLHRIL